MKPKKKSLVGELLISEDSQGYADRERIEDRTEREPNPMNDKEGGR
ncbi:MAG: hypothetical protein NT066_06610 [Candidatus Omnitrophica bacterium]|nr:hypothetical protein [Candidatus Omnitrophota bacterium]